MLHRIRVLTFLTIAALVFPIASWAADYKAALGTPKLEDGDSIVFLGDSITHQCLYTQYVEDYFYTRFPKMRLKFHNAGVGGAKAWDALERFERDVAAYKPKYVTVLLGMNDGRYQPYDEQTFRTYHKDMTALIGRLKELGATPILMTPTMYDSRAARMRKRKVTPEQLELYNSVLAYYGTWLREVAVENGFGFVDMYGPLNSLTLAQRKTDPNFTMIRDSVHPDPPGQLVMAYAILSDMGFQRAVSNTRIVKRGDTARATGMGGKVSDLKTTDTGISFTWQANSLPFVVPQEAQLGAKLLKLGHRMSREALEVHGLAAGSYELQIDGQVVGVYSREQLDRHIELQENAKTPQYQQALQVAELNKQRNAGPVKSLRNEWRQFQTFSRLRAQLKTSTENRPALQKRLEAEEKRLEGMEERIETHEKAARELEDKIFSINQPKPHQYVLKRVELAKITGRVVFNGQPLAKATVIFRSKQGAAGRGVTGAEGIFVLRTAGQPGLVPGAYTVTISKDELPRKYANQRTSPLTARVSTGGPNEFNFELTGD